MSKVPVTKSGPTSAVRMVLLRRKKSAFDMPDLDNGTHPREYVETLASGMATTQEQEAAAKKLRDISKESYESRLQIVDTGGIPVLVACLTRPDHSSTVVEDAVTVCFNLSMDEDLLLPLTAAGLLPPLLAICQEKCPGQVNATGVISNLSTVTENRLEITACGGIPILMNLARDNREPGLQNDAIIALFNLSVDTSCRAKLVDSGMVSDLLDGIEDLDPEVEEQVTLLLSSLLKEPRAVEEALESDGIPLLAAVLSADPRAQGHAAASLLLIARQSASALRQVQEEGLIPSLVRIAEDGTSRGKEKVTFGVMHCCC